MNFRGSAKKVLKCIDGNFYKLWTKNSNKNAKTYVGIAELSFDAQPQIFNCQNLIVNMTRDYSSNLLDVTIFG